MQETSHIGKMIEEKLRELKITKTKLARRVGLTQSTVSHITNREEVGVHLLQEIGNALQYDFFQHFPIEVPEADQTEVPDDPRIEELSKRIAELEALCEKHKGRNEALQQELLKQENAFLKQINELLKGK